jgi:hypothetical protein
MAPQIVVDRVIVDRHDGAEWIYFSPGHPNASLAIHLRPNTPVARIEDMELPRRGANPLLKAFIDRARSQLKTLKQVLRAKPVDALDEELLKSAGFTREPTGDYSLELRVIAKTEP